MSSIIDEIEGLLTEDAPLEVIPKIAGQMTLPFVAEEAAAAGVAVSLPELIPGLVVFGMITAASAWLRPSLVSQHHGKQSLLGRFVHFVGAKLAHAVHVIEARVLHAMSKWLGPKIRPITHFLNVITHLIHGLSQDVGDLADNTHEALVWLRHHVVPQMINHAVAPLRSSVRVLGRAVDSINTRLRTAAGEVADQLEQIGKTVGRTFTAAIGQLAATVVELWEYVHRTLAVQVQRLETAVDFVQSQVETVTGEVTALVETVQDTIMPELKRLGDLLAPAAFLAAVVAAVESSYGFLTCRNMKNMGTQACAFDEAEMARLLQLMFGLIAIADLRDLTRFVQSVEGDVGKLVKETLSA